MENINPMTALIWFGVMLVVLVTLILATLWYKSQKKIRATSSKPDPVASASTDAEVNKKSDDHGSSHEKSGVFTIIKSVLVVIWLLAFIISLSVFSYRLYFKWNGSFEPTKTLAESAKEFPYKGTRTATKTSPARAYIDPQKASTRITGPARYVFVGNKSIAFEDKMPGESNPKLSRKIAKKFPPGEYEIYAINDGEITVTWWHN